MPGREGQPCRARAERLDRMRIGSEIGVRISCSTGTFAEHVEGIGRAFIVIMFGARQGFLDRAAENEMRA